MNTESVFDMSTMLALLIGFLALLALLAIASLVLSAAAERKNPPIGTFIEQDGVRIHYLETGDPNGNPVVMFHGNGAMIQDFLASGLAERLARRYRVICFDRLGFGYSARPRNRLWTPEEQAGLFAGLLNKMQIHEPVVLGHSWGTLVALGLAMRNDYPVRGLVLASGYYFPTPRLDFWLMGGAAVPVLGDIWRYTFAPFVSLAMLPGLLRRIFAPRSVPSQFKRKFPLSLTVRPKQLRAAAEESAFLVPAAARLQQMYSQISCTVRLFHGAGDRLIEIEQMYRLDKALQRSRMLAVQDAGHMVHYADSAEIARGVDEIAMAERPRVVSDRPRRVSR